MIEMCPKCYSVHLRSEVATYPTGVENEVRAEEILVCRQCNNKFTLEDLLGPGEIKKRLENAKCVEADLEATRARVKHWKEEAEQLRDKVNSMTLALRSCPCRCLFKTREGTTVSSQFPGSVRVYKCYRCEALEGTEDVRPTFIANLQKELGRLRDKLHEEQARNYQLVEALRTYPCQCTYKNKDGVLIASHSSHLPPGSVCTWKCQRCAALEGTEDIEDLKVLQEKASVLQERMEYVDYLNDKLKEALEDQPCTCVAFDDLLRGGQKCSRCKALDLFHHADEKK